MEGPGGVFESGTQQEDGPVTWEALYASSRGNGVGTGGSEIPNVPASVGCTLEGG